MKMIPIQTLQVSWQRMALTALLALSIAPALRADGIYRDGVGAQSMSMGGSDVAWPGDPLSSLSNNPAGLGFLQGNQLDLGASGSLLTGHYSNRADTNGRLSDNFSGLPEGAVGFRLGSLPVTLGLGFYPESGLLADWHYYDVPGGADGKTTYGYQQFKSEIIVLRTAFGIGIQINPMLSIGASVGLIYNKNELQMPYIYQNQPALPRGFKTLLDLQTEGWGVDGNFGIQFHPNDQWELGLAYKTQTGIQSHGGATGDAYAQLDNLGLGAAPAAFHYDAEVDNTLPQSVSAGITWKPSSKWTLSGEIDWVDWSVFNTLPVKLTNGSNAAINGVVGSSSLGDYIPLDWSDEFVYRAGVEYAINDNWPLRAGYIYSKSPVPDSTLTSVTAVIAENTLTTGVGYHRGAYGIDLAYQYSIPASRTVGVSELAGGESSDSTMKLNVQTFALTATIKF